MESNGNTNYLRRKHVVQPLMKLAPDHFLFKSLLADSGLANALID